MPQKLNTTSATDKPASGRPRIYMIDRENQIVLKALDGDGRRFARLFRSEWREFRRVFNRDGYLLAKWKEFRTRNACFQETPNIVLGHVPETTVYTSYAKLSLSGAAITYEASVIDSASDKAVAGMIFCSLLQAQRLVEGRIPNRRIAVRDYDDLGLTFVLVK